jgi:NAD+ synthase (glutamine-hydrolysing)
LKIALSQLNYHVGNFDYNTAKIIEAIHAAKKMGAELIVFSELAITGYPPRDFLEFDAFIVECEKRIVQIASHCNDIYAIIGTPVKSHLGQGKNLFNAALVLHQGKVVFQYNKELLPTYDVFDENRYFESGKQNTCFRINGYLLAITVCEDLWNVGEVKTYPTEPMPVLAKEKPDVIINIAASPFSVGHDGRRKNVLIENALTYQIPVLYVNHVGAQTELIFDGGSLAVSGTGKIVKQLSYFKEDIAYVSLAGHELAVENEKEVTQSNQNPIALMHDALVCGIKDYFKKSGFKKAILGSSGGIDSALVQYLAVQALGAENVLAVLLPSRYSSDHSISDAKALCENLNNPYKIISIEESVSAFESTLAAHFENTPSGITEENIQARSRAVLLMALSNKFGFILLNTSNKSENAVGYGTLYGDMCGGLSVIGDVYKTQVYELARYANKDGIVIPENILNKAPSAELKPNQKDSDSLPDYDLLDKILYAYIEERKGPEWLINSGFESDLVNRVLRLVNSNEYKRHQTPPILRVSTKAFGMGRRMPIVAKYVSV